MSPQPPHIVHVLRSASYGGVERHACNLCELSLRRGARVSLVSLVDAPVHQDFLDLDIEVRKLGDRDSWSTKVFSTVFSLSRTLKQLAPSVVHLHGARPIFVGALAARWARQRPIVSTLHGSYSLMALDGEGKMRRSMLLAAKLTHWAGFALSNRIVLDSKALENEVRAVYRGLSFNRDALVRRKVRVAHNGVDIAPFLDVEKEQDIRDELGLSRSAVTFGTVSRLDEPKKGMAVLLHALRKVVDAGHDATLIISGEGWSRDDLEKLTASLGLTERVRFLGFWRNLLEVYRSLDVFVLPSFSEGFPTVNLEAMASALPVVTTDVGGCAEAVIEGETGFVVPPRDADALARAMGTICGQAEQRAAMGRAGRAFVRENFSREIMEQRVHAVYEEVWRGRAPQQAMEGSS